MCDELLGVEIGLGRAVAAERVGLVGQAHEQRVAIGVGIGHHRADALVAAGADDAHGDLAPVGDEQPPDRPGDALRTRRGKLS